MYVGGLPPMANEQVRKTLLEDAWTTSILVEYDMACSMRLDFVVDVICYQFC